MKKLNKNRIKFIISVIIAAIIFFLIIKVSIIKEMVLLILVSFIIGYFLKPINDKLIEHGLNEKASAIILLSALMLIIVIGIIMFIPSIFKESLKVEAVVKEIEIFMNDIYSKIKIISNNKTFYMVFKNINMRANNMVISIFDNFIEKLLSLGGNILSIAVIPIISYYFLADSELIENKVLTIFPISARAIAKKIIEDIDKVLCRYIWSQIILSALIGVLTFIILVILKIDFPIMLSILNAFFNIIPYFGPILGAVPIVIIAMLKSSQTALWAAFWLYILQQVEGNIISPKFIGDNVSIHPLIVILLLILGSKVGGFYGMLLAIPVGVILKEIYEGLNYYIF